MKICFILGTRPEIIKLYSCIKYCQENTIDFFIIHTNQHYSENMDQIFFDELELPKAKYNLGVHGGGHGEMTGKMMIEIEKVLKEEFPDVIFVQGDTNTVLAGGLVASKLGIKVAHIEAGLRSYDMRMPEEINRICVDHLSDYLFCPTQRQADIAYNESISKDKIIVVGNTIVDIVYRIKNLFVEKKQEYMEKYSIQENEYILVTMHRPSNVDSSDNLKNILTSLNTLQRISGKRILFPIHPRTRKNIESFGMIELIAGFHIIEPIAYRENIALQSAAFLIITDSGGIQEEACILEKKTLVLRENTERPETIEVGGAILVGNAQEAILQGYEDILLRKIEWYNPFGDGKTAEKIFSHIL